MPFYHDLKRYRNDPNYPHKDSWIASRLITLREDLAQQVTNKRKPNSLIVASWNIRAMDDGVQRLDESYHYIAEIISAFDVCAIQEIKGDTGPLERLRKLLGPNWDYFVSDLSKHTGGNNEGMAFFYNKNKLFFRRLIGELVIDPDELPDSTQFARSPYFAAFQAGWFRFVLCSTHIVFGETDEAGLQKRADEIALLRKMLVHRARNEDQVYVLLGDMNVDKKDGKIMRALQGRGMEVPVFPPSNMKRNKFYDQMGFATLGKSERKTKILRHNVFDWRRSVFGPAPGTLPALVSDETGVTQLDHAQMLAHYEPICAHQRRTADPPKEPYADFARQFGQWTTFEMSDHLPIWAELEVDYSNDYLRRFI